MYKFDIYPSKAGDVCKDTYFSRTLDYVYNACYRNDFAELVTIEKYLDKYFQVELHNVNMRNPSADYASFEYHYPGTDITLFPIYERVFYLSMRHYDCVWLERIPGNMVCNLFKPL